MVQLDAKSKRLWESIEAHILKSPPVEANPELVSHYREHDNPACRRGLFFNTQFQEMTVRDYHEMKEMLVDLATRYPAETRIFSSGKSQGYEGPESALEVWGLQVCSTEPSEHTAFFVAGHHRNELSGPETVYQIARRLLEDYQQGNPHVAKILAKTHVVFIPQVDVDYYNNLEKGNDSDYFTQGYAKHMEIRGFNPLSLSTGHNTNYYDETQHLFDFGYPVFKQTLAVKKAVAEFTKCRGPPYLAFDYHEGSSTGKYEVIQGGIQESSRFPLYVFAEVVKSYPVPNEYELQSIEEAREAGGNVTLPTFTWYLAHKGADSFLFETPSYLSEYSRAQRVEMNLIATDRILARYYLGL